MADEPISALTTLVTYNSGDYLEILDVGDFSFASTGTNKKVTVPALFAAASPGNTNGTTVLASSTAVTVSLATISGFSVSLPVAGTYMLSGIFRAAFTVAGTSGMGGFMVVQLFDTTNSVIVTGSLVVPIVSTINSSVTVAFQQSSPIGPVFYTVTAAATIVVQAKYASLAGGTISAPAVNSDTNGSSILSYLRIF